MAVVSGGTTLIDNGALDDAVPTGSLILLSTQTASSSSSLDFTSNIDSTYDSYVFKFINIHCSDDGQQFQFNMSTDGGSNYNVTKTTTHFRSLHFEDDSSANLSYRLGKDLAQSTANCILNSSHSNDNDSHTSGFLTLYNPSSTVFVKHFIAEVTGINDYSETIFTGGYGNTTSAINAVRFEMSLGTIDSGTIKMYGVA